MKLREERQKVMIRARMRSGASWHDVAILNLSRRGLGIQAADPPARGAYVEVCRGPHLIVARVVWSKGHRAGLHSQDPIFIEALIKEPSNDAPPARKAPGSPPAVERRRKPRTAQRHDQSRIAARMMEFACIAIVGAAMALAAFGMVEQALAQPLAQVRAVLGEESGPTG